MAPVADTATQPVVSPLKTAIRTAPAADTAAEKETPSLFRRKNKEKENATPTTQEQKLSEEVSQSTLEGAWEKFGKQRKEQGAEKMEAMILGRQIRLDQENTATILLHSSLEKSILDRIEMNLTAFLRAELKNDFIRMSHEVKEGETVKKLYTSSDKYDYMVTQNP
ncbi:MAG: hypothetical protein OEY56_05280, partial [Cyclobacteriaceae bacterium]|nr:hypothetical protein [Cyclobacteriaceae bacterium]